MNDEILTHGGTDRMKDKTIKIFSIDEALLGIPQGNNNHAKFVTHLLNGRGNDDRERMWCGRSISAVTRDPLATFRRRLVPGMCLTCLKVYERDREERAAMKYADAERERTWRAEEARRAQVRKLTSVARKKAREQPGLIHVRRADRMGSVCGIGARDIAARLTVVYARSATCPGCLNRANNPARVHGIELADRPVKPFAIGRDAYLESARDLIEELDFR